MTQRNGSPSPSDNLTETFTSTEATPQTLPPKDVPPVKGPSRHDPPIGIPLPPRGPSRG